ncbi:Rossmann-fold superfamily protein [Perilla frutescens var. hirtella]|uniref:Dihydroflavonol 4-reductase n=1 Tax=Perilla frutescens var. hirtella TaxID=608512 RepID=A0AAD4J0T5_PERFH|nr:Rossmann-fold superfamily protein [Perilla frutescens var. hirtella]
MGKVVCVTGASGYIASWLVKLLLQRGDSSKVEHLTALEGANERLHLYEASLLEEGSFDSAVDGCDGVFHTASPVFLSVSDPQTELIEPALKGTINVLESCTKASTIKRVVITSSITTVMYNHNSLQQDFTVDETWFSDPIFCEENKKWYALSKTLAEKAAVKLAEENGLDLVTLHPGYTIGPPLQPSLNLSSVGLLDLIKEGKQILANGVYHYVDVRDVALAHVLALENPSASGRYCLVARVAYSFEALDILKRICPSLDLPPTEPENRPDKVPYQVSKERAESLGVNFRPLEVTLKDSVESFRERNLITF